MLTSVVIAGSSPAMTVERGTDRGVRRLRAGTRRARAVFLKARAF
jgi:hypothetical protein